MSSLNVFGLNHRHGMTRLTQKEKIKKIHMPFGKSNMLLFLGSVEFDTIVGTAL